MIDPDAAVTFLDFAVERHRVWEKRQNGEPQPWTKDSIIATRKFTNTFRVLDYGSQWMIQELLDPELEPREILARCFLYRHTNLPSAWEAYRNDTGSYPTTGSLDDLLEFWTGYKHENGQLFSGAYMVYPQSSKKGTTKHESVIRLTQRLFCEEDLTPDFLRADTQEKRFHVLRRNKGVADFMSMQILTDWGYSQQCGADRENEFVVAGPGAILGALALDSEADPEDTIRWAQKALIQLKSCPTLELWTGELRRPSLLDCQNLACEFSKYIRHASKPSLQKPYTPAHPGLQSEPTLPAHW